MKKQKKISVLWEDESCIFINKPSGVLSIPDRLHPEKFCLSNYLKLQHQEIYTVHRLDRDTSGVICFAKTENAHRSLSQQFENRATQKTYLALTEGRLNKSKDTIELPIAATSKGNKMKISSNGKSAITHYTVQQHFNHCTLINVQIETGRTHQIRVHLAAIGYPLLVDPLYGKRDAFYLSSIKGRRFNIGKHQEERPLLDRLSLHAYTLKVNHPLTKEPLTIEAPLPKDLKALINQLQKNSNPQTSS